MAETKPTKKSTPKSTKSGAVTEEKFAGLTEEERAAMKERTKELKATARSDKKKADGEADVLAKIEKLVKKAVS